MYEERRDEALKDASDWFAAASSIVHVEAVTGQFDPSTEYCEPVADFEDERSKSWSSHLTCISIFSLSWAGFECVVNGVVDAAEIRRNGKVNAAIAKISSMSNQLHTLYDELLEYTNRFSSLIDSISNKHPHHQKALEALKDKTENAASVLNAIRHLRNAIAHGSFRLPDFDDDGEYKTHIALVEASTHLLLMAVQNLIFVSLEGNEQSLEVYFPYNIGELDHDPMLRDILLSGSSLLP
ncbi:MAG: hypothetical protein HQL64_08875 [Magnetococcales bacterium]|nr:hypothetical protein [Magnetococcales bacterium]